VTSIYQISLIVAIAHHITQIGQEPKKPAKTTGLKMGQGKFWAHFRRGDSQYFSEPEEDCSSVVSGCGGAYS